MISLNFATSLSSRLSSSSRKYTKKSAVVAVAACRNEMPLVSHVRALLQLVASSMLGVEDVRC